MEIREVEELLGELESRIERLRALYEQYFMGIEKLEPQIPRKDVDRRIWVLRREQIRNTGLRFKFQMLIQRYNTFQQYWGRTTREIETGTYRRDVLRAAQRFGDKAATTILGKRRAERYARLAEAQRAQKDRRSEAPGNGAPAASDSGEWTEVDMSESDPPPAPGAAPPLVPGRRPPEPQDADAARRKVAALAAQMRAQRAHQEEMVRAEGPLDLDLDLDTRRPPPRRSLTPNKLERPLRRSSSGRMKAVQIPPAPGLPADLGPPPPRRRSSASMRAVKQPPPEPIAPPEPAPPAVRPAPARPPAAGAPPRAADDGTLPEQRIRQIYAKYVETKRASNESTAGVTYEKLAESLRAQAEKLKVSHPARKVDYEVVVKDGKTLLKPILR